MTLRGFATLNLWADDVEKAAAWYAAFLGVDPYFTRPGPDGRLAYAEFRVGDLAAELGIVDSRFRPGGAQDRPGGALMYWHVDDLPAAVADLIARGAVEYEPITPRGDSGFVTASVVDPFGNILAIMTNPHYVDVIERLAER